MTTEQILIQECAKRRKKLMQSMLDQSIAIIPSAPMKLRNGDTHYRYRQNSDFYYLTGFKEPEAVAVLLKDQGEGHFILFNRPRDPAAEQWDGCRAGQEGACENYAADRSIDIAHLETEMLTLLPKVTNIYYDLGFDPQYDKAVIYWLNTLRKKVRSGINPPQAMMALHPILHEMRLIKSEYEITCIKKAVDISVKGHQQLMKRCRSGLFEHQLAAELMSVFYEHGAQETAYDSIVAGGENACVLHYVHNDHVIQKDTLILVDAGCEYQYYAADITRTFPADGRFQSHQKALYEIVLEAQQQAISLIKPGVLFTTLQETVVKILTQGLVDLKLLKGDVTTLIEQKAYQAFYMHNSGHWLGLDVHDVGSYKEKGLSRALQPGMVLTVEPGLYTKGIGIRIEDDVLVTREGCEVLSEALPKTVDEIETLMSK